MGVCVPACMGNSFRGLTADPVQMGGAGSRWGPGLGLRAVVCSWNICLCYSPSQALVRTGEKEEGEGGGEGGNQRGCHRRGKRRASVGGGGS